MFESKLPDVGTTIFTTMSQLAAEHNAINLSQGFPDFDGHNYLRQRVAHYINQGLNQYAPMSGLPALREQIAAKTQHCYGRRVDPDSEVTVTSGATEALFAAIHAVVRAGDEVIVFDPAYDSYDPAVQLAGGVPIHLPLNHAFSIDVEELEQAINSKTRLIIINSPHNPSGAALSEDTLRQIEQCAEKHDLYLISDEVYEHIIFDDELHQSVNRFESLASRSFIVSSFGKTFHTTGWKVGYCVAPANLTTEFRKVHQYLTFCTVTPIQAALADMLEKHPEQWQQLSSFYQGKRDHLRTQLTDSRFKLLPCQGTYFQLVDFSEISDKSEVEFAHWMTTEVGVASVPISVFYQPQKEQHLVRLCFAKNESTLTEAAKKLCQL